MSEATDDLLAWGIVAHLIADWLFQNEWMALNKVSLRHPAAYVHSGIHAGAMLLVFPWPVAVGIGITHLLIDTRKPVAWWANFIHQTQPNPSTNPASGFDIGWDVRIWTDQVFHIAVVAVAAGVTP